MKNKAGKLFVLMFVFGSAFVFYVIWDNNRLTVVEQEVAIENLPEQLNDFRILQITDLHEKEFGDNQQKLIDKVNAVDYDVIVFTGDMLDSVESTNYEPFYTLLEGISNKDNAWFVPGNTDPESYQISSTVDKSDFIQGMEQRGVTFLETFETVKVEGANIHFVDFEISILDNPENAGPPNGIVQPSYATNEQYFSYRSNQVKEMPDLNQLSDDDVVVAVNHYPVADPRIDYIEKHPGTSLKNYDLVIAGHYHGGQIRFPLLGAVLVPEPWYESGSFFPPQDRVKGLWEYKQVKQYVSTGLGSSDAIGFLKFRFYNPPEMNVLTLKQDKS